MELTRSFLLFLLSVVFASRSALLYSLVTQPICTVPAACTSRTPWQQIALCFLLRDDLETIELATTDLLSHNMSVGVLSRTPKLRKFQCKDSIISTKIQRATDSLPKLEDLTVFCLLLKRSQGNSEYTIIIRSVTSWSLDYRRDQHPRSNLFLIFYLYISEDWLGSVLPRQDRKLLIPQAPLYQTDFYPHPASQGQR